MIKIILTLSMLAIAGLIWGMREFFHRSPAMFSVIWEKSPTGFWGRLGWTRKYKNYPEDKRYKNFILAIFPYNDFYHLSWYAVKILLIVGTLYTYQILDSIGSQVLITLIAVMFVTTVWAGLTYMCIRKLYGNDTD